MDVPIPFSVDDYSARMDSAVYEAFEAGLDGVLVTPGPDLLWLTGYQPVSFPERFTMLVLVRGRPPALVVPTAERPRAETAPAAGCLRIVDWADSHSPYLAASGLLPMAGRFAVSDTTWSAHLLGLRRVLPNSRYGGLGDVLPMLRAVKDGNELGRLAMAAAAADEVYLEIARLPFAGLRERDIAASLAALLRAFGHEHVDFTVVGSGPNTANPHHAATDREIAAGDTVVLDFGGRMYGYGSDTTRTVSVGDPGSEVQEVHSVVLTAQRAAIEAVRPGVTCQDIGQAVRSVITEAGYGGRFEHRVGHGVGVTTHEPPYLAEGQTWTLEPGMCVAIDPGVYLPGRFGVRIKDVVAVTEDGGDLLTNAGRELRVVD